MFKNLLLGVSLIVTVANISPAQAQTTVVSKVKNKIKGLRTKTHTTLTQLITKHDHPHNLNTVSSVISDAVAEKENILPLDLTKGLLTPKGDIKSKIGFFNNLFGSNTPKNELLDPTAKKRQLPKKPIEKFDKVELKAEPKIGAKAGPVEKTTHLQNDQAMKVTPAALLEPTSSLQKTNTNEDLTRIQLKKSPMRVSILPDREKHSMPWGRKLTPSQIKALEKAQKTDAMPTPTLELLPGLDLTPVVDIKDEVKADEAKTLDASLLLSRASIPIDTSSIDATPTSTVDLTPVVDIKDEVKADEAKTLDAPLPAPPPPPMPPSRIKIAPKEVSLNLEDELNLPPIKMDKASSVTSREPNERSNLLEAIRQGKPLKKTPLASESLSEESSIMRIDETIITTARTFDANEEQKNGLFAGLFKTIGNFLKGKSTSTLDDPDLKPLEGARFKDYSVSYKHTIDDGFSESTYLLYFTNEAAKKSYINKISSFDDEEDEKDFAESYSLSPTQTHIRQLQEKRLTEVKKLEDKTAEALRPAQAIQNPTDKTEQEKLTTTMITSTLGSTQPILKTDDEGSENPVPKTNTGGIISKTTSAVFNLLDSIKGFTRTALKKMTNKVKPAEKPKNDIEDKILSRRNKMGYSDKNDLDWD
ncbi:MAG: hypothetical protein K2X53_04770 [Alphaproteobacteria bacterium]|nr:hypothetical protein [Alphaproteobacteria bacterium]